MQSAKPNIVEQGAAPADSWLQQLHEAGISAWQSQAWPTRNTESWKYTPLKLIDNIPASSAHETEAGDHDLAFVSVENAYRMVFIDGLFQEQLSELGDLPEGVDLINFAQASEEQGQSIQTLLAGLAKSQTSSLFADLNKATVQDGVLLQVGPARQLDKPLVIVNCASSDRGCRHYAPRLVVSLARSAQAEVIEYFASADDQTAHFCSSVADFVVGDNAELQHTRLHLEDGPHRQVGSIYYQLERDARVKAFHLALGCQLQRNDIVVRYQAEGGQCHLNGVYAPLENQFVDFHTCIEHAVSHCTSQENFRGIVGDTAKAVFNGRIHIHPQAQKTLAQLNNRNLLTSERAEVNSKPELEIYADDVQCAHGATVAQLDTVALHYFKTRGISEREAEVMLSFGFINELLNEIKNDALVQYLRPLLAKRFARDQNLLRHIG